MGTGVSHDLPMHKARSKAIEAAEKRAAQQRLLGGPGRTLGGPGPKGIVSKSPRELAAEVSDSLFMLNLSSCLRSTQAAERRARDEKACAAGSDALVEAQKAAEQSILTQAIEVDDEPSSEDEATVAPKSGSVIDVIDLTSDDEVEVISSQVRSQHRPSTSSLPALRSQARINPTAPKDISALSASTESTSYFPPRSITPPTPAESWTCQTCTLINELIHLQCMVCQSLRPKSTLGPSSISTKDGWVCLVCGETGIDHQFWSCRTCGSIKSESVV